MAKRVLRPIRIEGQVAYVPLTKGLFATIDVSDIGLVEGFNWSAAACGTVVYAVRKERVGGKQRRIYMHRLIVGAENGSEVDHKDCFGLNNRRANLRLATHAQNARNRGAQATNTSGFKRVDWHSARGKWRARIEVDGVEVHLGLYASAHEAHIAYQSASTRLHKEFGRTE